MVYLFVHSPYYYEGQPCFDVQPMDVPVVVRFESSHDELDALALNLTAPTPTPRFTLKKRVVPPHPTHSSTYLRKVPKPITATLGEVYRDGGPSSVDAVPEVAVPAPVSQSLPEDTPAPKPEPAHHQSAWPYQPQPQFCPALSTLSRDPLMMMMEALGTQPGPMLPSTFRFVPALHFVGESLPTLPSDRPVATEHPHNSAPPQASAISAKGYWDSALVETHLDGCCLRPIGVLTSSACVQPLSSALPVAVAAALEPQTALPVRTSHPADEKAAVVLEKVDSCSQPKEVQRNVAAATESVPIVSQDPIKRQRPQQIEAHRQTSAFRRNLPSSLRATPSEREGLASHHRKRPIPTPGSVSPVAAPAPKAKPTYLEIAAGPEAKPEAKPAVAAPAKRVPKPRAAAPVRVPLMLKPPCDHSESWKCRRVKLGTRHMLCRECLLRWKQPPSPSASVQEGDSDQDENETGDEADETVGDKAKAPRPQKPKPRGTTKPAKQDTEVVIKNDDDSGLKVRKAEVTKQTVQA